VEASRNREQRTGTWSFWERNIVFLDRKEIGLLVKTALFRATVWFPSQKGNGLVRKSCLIQTPFGLEVGSEKSFSEELK
jgi:hypothetical protein